MAGGSRMVPASPDGRRPAYWYASLAVTTSRISPGAGAVGAAESTTQSVDGTTWPSRYGIRGRVSFW